MNSKFLTDQKTIAIFTITEGYRESFQDQKGISPWRADLSFLQVIIIGSDIPLPRLACKGCSRLNLFTKLFTMQTDARLVFKIPAASWPSVPRGWAIDQVSDLPLPLASLRIRRS